jgi:hypothetical protein
MERNRAGSPDYVTISPEVFVEEVRMLIRARPGGKTNASFRKLCCRVLCQLGYDQGVSLWQSRKHS